MRSFKSTFMCFGYFLSTASTHKIGNCAFFVYDDYVVVQEELTGGEIGSDIFVKVRMGENFPEVNCKKLIGKHILKILNKWAEYFLAKKDNF